MTPSTYHRSGVTRAATTGTLQTLRCPSPGCLRFVPVRQNRMDEHDSYLTGERCQLSGAEVLDKARP